MADSDPVIDLARSQPFRLGALEVDPPRRRVSTGETLEPRVMQVLVALARADGKVVSRDELVRTCWDGRIVGDDSITRVIGALRRLDEDHSGGAFAIETVPKVGYRLVGDVLPVVAAPLAARPSAMRDPAVVWWQRPRGVAAGVAVAVAVAVAGVALWTTRPTPPVTVAVQFTGYRALGDISPALPEAVADATRSAFTEDGRVAVTSRLGDFRLGGSIASAGSVFHVASRIDNARSGAVLWSRVVDIPLVSEAQLATRTAALTVQLARCALSQAAIHGRPLSDEVLTLLFAECAAESTPDNSGRALDLARKIADVAPELASGWASRAYFAKGLSQGTVPGPTSALADEARASIANALALNPRDSRAWHTKVYLTPSTDLVAIDRAYRAALWARVSDCGCVFMDYGKFLLAAGRAV